MQKYLLVYSGLVELKYVFSLVGSSHLSIIKIFLDILDNDSFLVKFIIDPVQENTDKLL
jgi:hypothetical protein